MSTPAIWAGGYGGFTYRVLTCKTHKRYTGALRPRRACAACYYLWFSVHGFRVPDGVI